MSGVFPGVTPLRAAMQKCYAALLGVLVFSAIVNVLSLTSSVYMLQVYDRVLPSGSVPTLVVLTIAMVGLLAAYGLLDLIRQQTLLRISNRFDALVRDRTFQIQLALPLHGNADNNRIQPLRDLDQIRSFLASPGTSAFFDLPWLPFYLVLVYLMHPWLGLLSVAGAVVIVAVTLFAELLSRGPSQRTAQSVITRQLRGEAARRNAEVVRAMGMERNLRNSWMASSTKYLEDQRTLSDLVSGTAVLSRTLRMILQSAILALGAYVVLRGEATAGIIIASSILSTRALSPIDVIIANWRGFLQARQSWRTLARLLETLPQPTELMPLPRPTRTLGVENLAISAPGGARPIIAGVTFALQAGAGLGIIGPSAAGKSSLVRGLVGVWPPARGKVLLDGAALSQYDPLAVGRDIGYLPQDIELFDGTVAENIGRMQQEPDAALVLAAANAAGAHAHILKLPDGYNTRIGDQGVSLSAGQRQLVGLARALYGEPFLVVLDEPNSNLDSDGDLALSHAIEGVRRRGGIVIVVAHRPSALANIDQLLFMSGGAMAAFGPRDAVLAKVLQASGQRGDPKQAPPTASPGDAPAPSSIVPLHRP